MSVGKLTGAKIGFMAKNILILPQKIKHCRMKRDMMEMTGVEVV